MKKTLQTFFCSSVMRMLLNSGWSAYEKREYCYDRFCGLWRLHLNLKIKNSCRFYDRFLARFKCIVQILAGCELSVSKEGWFFCNSKLLKDLFQFCSHYLVRKERTTSLKVLEYQASDPLLLEHHPTNNAEKKNSHFWQSLQDLSCQIEKKKKKV